MKHLVFADYFDKWVKILGKHNPLNYIDGFGGIGAYENDGKIVWGSPILASKIIIDNNINLKRNPDKIKILIIDEKKENLENIKKVIQYLKYNINPIYINEDFDKTINKILDETPNIAPTFFFIDPFGFKIKMSTLKRIMKTPKSEILLNFMWNGVNRNLSNPDANKILRDLFGCDNWNESINIPKIKKEKILIELYRKQLKDFCKFVCYYRVSFPKMKRTFYYLFHLTNHIKGCSIMKSCFAKFNFGRVEYRGKTQYQKTLLEGKEVKIEEIKKIILSQFKNGEKLYINLLEGLIDETPYLESEILSAVRELEMQHDITIVRNPETTLKGRKRKSILNSDRIIY